MSEFNIEGMKCQSCVVKMGDELNKAGYRDATVTLNPPRVKFASSTVTDSELQAILSNAGDYKIEKSPGPSVDVHKKDVAEENLTPLFIILLYLIGGVILRASISNDYSLTSLMNNFMGGFFIVFSLFKLLNLSGFAEAYATYDLVASRSRTYALAYPFVELILGVAYFIHVAPLVTNIITFGLMSVGSIGVLQALRTKRKFQCACLGTVLKLPMTKVTLVEDVTMGLMALIMIILHGG